MHGKMKQLRRAGKTHTSGAERCCPSCGVHSGSACKLDCSAGAHSSQHKSRSAYTLSCPRMSSLLYTVSVATMSSCAHLCACRQAPTLPQCECGGAVGAARRHAKARAGAVGSHGQRAHWGGARGACCCRLVAGAGPALRAAASGCPVGPCTTCSSRHFTLVCIWALTLLRVRADWLPGSNRHSHSWRGSTGHTSRGKNTASV